MNFKIGDKVRYYFPEPINADNTYFSGEIEFAGVTYMVIRNLNGILLRISYKNFEWVKPEAKIKASI